jgi:hypothetical protein
VSGDITTRLSRKVMITALLVAGTFWFAKHPTGAFMMTQEREGGNRSLAIVITSTAAPLQILSSWVESATPQNFRLVLQVQNQSGKGIRAYAITSRTATSKRQNGNSQFMNITQRSSVWQPTEIRSIEVNDSLDDQIRSVKLTIDFIEFTDGTTWGPDSENSRDLLAGQREAAKFEKQRLRKLMETKGPEALAVDAQAIDGSRVESAIESGHSVKWEEGFRQGVNAVRRRLRNAIASGSKEQIKAELSRPFDTAEGEAPK